MTFLTEMNRTERIWGSLNLETDLTFFFDNSARLFCAEQDWIQYCKKYK